jgi:hypothetical protein
MRRILLLTAIALLSASWSLAQTDTSPEAASRDSGYGATLVGCLTGAAGTYTLTLPAGSIYQLSANEAWLKTHVGESVRVWGVVLPVVSIPGSMSEGTSTEPTVQIHALQPLSGACTPTSNTIR